MNIYEILQNAIDKIEGKLEEKINIEEISLSSGMSKSNLYRFFLSIVGYSVKEYIRLRRISEAAMHLKSGKTATYLSFLYDYESLDTFSRAFKKITGFLPSQYKKQYSFFKFKKINLIERNFMRLEEKALDIQILKHMNDFEVVTFNYYGKNPEDGAFALFKEWVKKNKLDIVSEGLRVFGYNNPNPIDDSGIYGYEVCLTLNEKVKKNANPLDIKIIKGGMYALVTVKKEDRMDIGGKIAETWQRFGSWLQNSKFQLSERQWLEEHHGFDEMLDHIGNIDLYMSIDYKNTNVNTDEIRNSKIFDVSIYDFKGSNAIDEGRKYSMKWLSDHNIDLTKPSEPIYIFGRYDFRKEQNDDFVFQLCIVTPDSIKVKGNPLKGKILGGLVVRQVVLFKDLNNSWEYLLNKYSKHKEYKLKNTIVFEQYLIDENINEQMRVLQVLELDKK
ncbi:effector binding domain-containing protein [Haploplasma axanthum]|uniref:Right origin-binding protein n=1 Tax=Haploplasma axanthum TaxID=29552 RepID=A0A449BFP5_HAPAX|nr:effector binding domain-containing protein [Haploplasma axanthum]VEU81261.1 Right origin-binding protein [Haploplasma axanthum]